MFEPISTLLHFNPFLFGIPSVLYCYQTLFQCKACTSHLSSLHLYVLGIISTQTLHLLHDLPLNLACLLTSVNHAYGTLCSSLVPFWLTVPYKIWMPVIGLLIEFSIILASFHKGKYDHFSLNVWLQLLGFLLFLKG